MNMNKILKNIKSGLLREDHVCPWWLAFTFDNPLRRFLHDPEKILSSLVKPGMVVADIGCGMGYFSVAMAGMVGEKGKVLSVDIQQKMLDHLMKRARKQGRTDRIRPMLVQKGDIGIREQVDFVLTFWMVHETGDIPRFLKQVASIFKQGGTLLIAEPRMHISSGTFETILQNARDAGFRVNKGPRVGWSRTALLVKN